MKHRDLKGYTFFSARHGTYSRIYMIFATRDISDQIVEVEIGKRLYSDQAGVFELWNIQQKKKQCGTMVTG